MPKFSINDKVSFINEKQDGIIKSFKTGGICVVEIEDGFEIDALENELVLIRTTTIVKPEVQSQKTTKEKVVPEFKKNMPAITSGVWLVTCPAEEGMVLTGPADYYLVNNTDYDLLFSASFRKGKKINGLKAEKVLQGHEIFIGKVKREEAFDFEAWHFQLLFFKQNEFEPQSTITKEIPVLFPDLTSANSKLDSPYAFCKCDLIGAPDIVDLEQSDALFSKYSVKDLKDAMISNTGKSLKNEKSSSRSAYSQFEVDLHIEDLVESFEGLSNSEIINIQLNYFHKKLDEALYKKAYKIIFIHGVGNGKLKSAIRNELIAHNFKFTDAAYEQYGGGATEVIL